jgi:CheY-like chemotaxis protein
VKPKLLLVDDEENILQQMRWSMEADYEIFTASNEEVATQIFAREHPPVVILDLSLSRHKADDLGGLRLLEQFLSAEPATRAIVLTGISEDVNGRRRQENDLRRARRRAQGRRFVVALGTTNRSRIWQVGQTGLVGHWSDRFWMERERRIQLLLACVAPIIQLSA